MEGHLGVSLFCYGLEVIRNTLEALLPVWSAAMGLVSGWNGALAAL